MPPLRRSSLTAVLVALTLALVANTPVGAAPPPPEERVVGPGSAAPPATPPGPGLPAEDRSRGVVFADLEVATDGPCRGLLEARSGSALCTHGPDAAVHGRDVRVPRGTAELAAATTTTGAVPCYGDGSSGNRIQAVYARAADRADRYADVVALIRQWAAATDKVFADSAAATGGDRHLRWATDPACNLVVERVQLSTRGDDSFSATRSELQSLGFNRTDRKYLVWVDANVYCGIAGIWNDDRATAENANNAGPSYARVDNGCWGLTNSVEAHEVMHNLGGVQLSAPHSTGGWHCTDESDRMCYSDAAGVTMTPTCASMLERLFDCNSDDYFHVSPPAGSYLAGHWNAAANRFLETAAPPASTTTTAPPPSTTTSSTTTTVPAPSTSTSTFSGSLNRKTLSRTHSVTTGAGSLTARLTFTKATSMTLDLVRASDGAVLSRAGGASPVAASIPVADGRYRLVVAANGANASYTLTVTYPTP